MMIELLNMLGEFAIAFVIYYEIEENRAESFLSEVQSDKFYGQRRKLYEAYVNALPLEASLKDRAEAFAETLWKDGDLRTLCDQQWATVYRLRYALRRSIFHRRTVEKWFPHVLISLWVMTNRYLRERQDIRPLDLITEHGPIVVRDSLCILKRHGNGKIPPITIYGEQGARVKISGTVLDQMLVDLDAPFK
jgi:hypothetical protein